MLLVTRVLELHAGTCDIEFSVLGYSGKLRIEEIAVPIRVGRILIDPDHLASAKLERTDDHVLRTIEHDSSRRQFCVFKNERNTWRDPGNDGEGYFVYFDGDTFRPIAKFHDPKFRHECVGTADPFGVRPPEWVQRLKHDPPFDFLGLAEEWKMCLEHIVKLELLVRGPRWVSVREGMTM
jgi:hypothetical protein